jgi:hypothetical protein
MNSKPQDCPMGSTAACRIDTGSGSSASGGALQPAPAGVCEALSFTQSTADSVSYSGTINSAFQVSKVFVHYGMCTKDYGAFSPYTQVADCDHKYSNFLVCLKPARRRLEEEVVAAEPARSKAKRLSALRTWFN